MWGNCFSLPTNNGDYTNEWDGTTLAVARSAGKGNEMDNKIIIASQELDKALNDFWRGKATDKDVETKRDKLYQLLEDTDGF